MERIKFEAVQHDAEKTTQELEVFENAPKSEKFATEVENIEYRDLLEKKVQRLRAEMEYAISNGQAMAEMEDLVRSWNFQEGANLETSEQKLEAFRSVAHRLQDMDGIRFFSHLKGVTELMFLRTGDGEHPVSVVLGYPDYRVSSNVGTSVINIDNEGHVDGYETLPGLIKDIVKSEDVLAEIARCVHLQYPKDNTEVLSLNHFDENGNILEGAGAISAYGEELGTFSPGVGGVRRENPYGAVPYFGRDNIEMFENQQDLNFRVRGTDYFVYENRGKMEVHPMNREYDGFVNTWGVVKESTEQGNATYFFIFDRAIDQKEFEEISLMPRDEKQKGMWKLLNERGYFDDLPKSRGELGLEGMRYPHNHPQMRRNGTLVSKEEYKIALNQYCEDVFRYGHDKFEQKNTPRENIGSARGADIHV